MVRYGATLAAVAFGSAAVVGVPLYLLSLGLLKRALDDRLEGTAELAALILPELGEQDGPGDRLDLAPGHTLNLLRDEADLDAICVLRPDGTLLRASEGRPGACVIDPADAGLLTRIADSAHTDIRTDNEGTPYLFAFAPIGGEGAPAGILAVRASAPYLERLGTLQARFGTACVVWVGLVGLLGAWGAGRLVRPIERLLLATERLGAGEHTSGPSGENIEGAGELETLQRAFSEMSIAVRSRETTLRALAGAVAHEVRNPSNALRLHLGLLQRELGAGDPAVIERTRSRLVTLQDQLDQLDATVEAFLLFASDRAARRVPVDIHALLERAGDGASVDAPAVTVEVDPVLLGRAVGNLVGNARQAGGEPVCVRARVGSELVIEVEDQGPGFPPELRERAFEPFVRGRADGSGLGLAIVAAVARAHGGSVRLAVTGPGRTVVELTLPLR